MKVESFISQNGSRELAKYGVCINLNSLEVDSLPSDEVVCYVFNRGYYVLDIRLTNEQVTKLREVAIVTKEGFTGKGRYLPDMTDEKSSDWETIYLFDDETAPEWDKDTFGYDCSKYE